MDFNQTSFLGGLNYQVDSSKHSATEYHLLINGRTRRDIIDPIFSPLDLSDKIPSGKYQGCYSAGSYLLVFVSGKAYWTNTDISGFVFTQVLGFQMSPTEDWIWAEAVPASTINKGRIVTVGSNAVNTSTTINGSVACIICQDGVTRPHMIFANGTARQAKDYLDWSEDGTAGDREYVPIGRQMLWYDGKLYLVTPDGKGLYHSVTGRPVDFMVVVGSEETGGRLKLAPNEGGQIGVIHRVDYNTITAIRAVTSSAEGGFLVSTRYGVYIVQPDYSDTYFGEPSFSNLFLFSAGLNNQNCMAEVHGDTLIIDQESINSFNQTKQLRQASNNDTISGKIFQLFSGITQVHGAAVVFDDSALFAMRTLLGPAVIVYDTVTKVFSGLDIYEGVAEIKQFAEVRGVTGRKLFFITGDNKLYQAYGDTSRVERTYFTFGEWCSGDPRMEQKVNKVRAIFNDSKSDGTITASLYCDKRPIASESHKIVANNTGVNTIPITLPFGNITRDTTQIETFDFTNTSKACWKVAVTLSWDFNGSLSFLGINSEDVQHEHSYETASREYDLARNGTSPAQH